MTPSFMNGWNADGGFYRVERRVSSRRNGPLCEERVARVIKPAIIVRSFRFPKGWRLERVRPGAARAQHPPSPWLRRTSAAPLQRSRAIARDADL